MEKGRRVTTHLCQGHTALSEEPGDGKCYPAVQVDQAQRGDGLATSFIVINYNRKATNLFSSYTQRTLGRGGVQREDL